MLNRIAVVAALALLAASCAAPSPSYRSGDACLAKNFKVTDQFAGARRGRCTVLADDHVRLHILPESSGSINNSPWFAFKIEASAATTATITLHYEGGEHRYKPKHSEDGLHWQVIDDTSVVVSEDKTQVDIRVPISATTWIAAQEVITPAFYDAWNRQRVKRSDVEKSVLGQSRGELPIHLLSTDSRSNNVLLLVSRQHPPEVTGALAFFSFYETLLADTDLANDFRDRVQILAVPLMNPDGVVGGNWRHNLDHTDLNRDWGPFKQPETQAVARLLDRLDRDGKKIRVFLDFHSTQQNVFYTQDTDNEHTPPRFTRRWLDNARPRVEALQESYEFENQENPTSTVGVSKNYMYHRYGIPASTYELGDETDRVAIRKASAIFAEELMKLMLEQDYTE